ncbi:MAG: Ldh family oxidoreductase [Candidatus Dormibacteraeota bacterium]|nr:Ldh family oxidoreductase [Candidatus Dormibacteraeota bacterium]
MTAGPALRRCRAGELESFARAVLTAMGADREVGEEVARHLVRANLSGHDSHGVLRLSRYVRQMDAGSLVPAARPELVHERGPVAVFDVRRSFGHYATARALEWAMERARTGGLAAAALREPTHIGRLGEYTERAAEAGLVGLVTFGTAGEGVGIVLPHGGAAPALSTNPWSIGVPGAGGRAVVFDAATTVVAEGKVQVAKDAGRQLPAGSIVAGDGSPSRDPGDFYAGGALLPLGGEVAGHKGYGLALTAALLGGLAMSGASSTAPPASGVLVLVIDPAWFGDGDAYASLVADTVRAVKRTPPAGGVEEVLVAGEPERRNRELRGREGVELAEGTWEGLREVGERFQVPMPSPT